MAAAAQRYREFKMPDVGEGLTEAEILAWHVKPGDTVTDGQMVVEVETAKAAVELPIPYDGTVRELLFEEGATVDVGTPIITVDTAPGAGEEAPAGTGGAAGAAEPEGAAGEGGGKREPVLVGYGVSTASTKRRAKKVPAGAGARTGADAGVGGPATDSGAVTGEPAAGPGTAVAGGTGRAGGPGPQAHAPAAA
ncbi:biotin/lipoyl-containing protein, partial [Streptomyces sodiiphilus]|uniref:biotin/lipoyl-containing protein n=1 Tax=Streptomyces sodiiphilus TaxID=226217 RepID=UPI0031E1836F